MKVGIISMKNKQTSDFRIVNVSQYPSRVWLSDGREYLIPDELIKWLPDGMFVSNITFNIGNHASVELYEKIISWTAFTQGVAQYVPKMIDQLDPSRKISPTIEVEVWRHVTAVEMLLNTVGARLRSRQVLAEIVYSAYRIASFKHAWRFD